MDVDVALAGLLVVGAGGYAAYLYVRDAQEPPAEIIETVYLPPAQSSSSGSSRGQIFAAFAAPLLDGLFDNLGRNVDRLPSAVLGGGSAAPAPVYTPYVPPGTYVPAPQAASSRGVGGLLDLIGRAEAPRGYDQVYGGSLIQPDRPLSSMTVNEVLAYQDRSVANGSKSSAAGRYQIIRGTLRGQVASGVVSGNDRFDADTQDKLAVSLADGRGLSDFQAGRISETTFAQNLSKEWAGLPAQTSDARGRQASGQSYYAGDGLNASTVSRGAVLSTIRGI